MRQFVTFVAVLWAVTALAAAAEPTNLRDVDSLVFEGLNAFKSDELAHVLRTNFDVARAAHPDARLEEYLQAVERTLLVAYQHSGFREAATKATHDAARQRITVSVREGPRHVCGDVHIAGCPEAAIAAVRRRLTADGEPEKIVWRKGQPVPFDALTAAEIQRHVHAGLAEAGHFAAKFDVEIAPLPKETCATLKVTVSDAGRPATIGRIIVTGNRRNRTADIIEFLELREGLNLHSQLPQRLAERLESTGRFLTCEAEYAPSKTESADDQIYDVILRVREYDSAPLLTESLAEKEQAALKLGEWARRWSRGEEEEDIVLQATLGKKEFAELFVATVGETPEAGDAATEEAIIRVISSPRRGTIITLRAESADGRPVLDEAIALYPDRLVLGSPRRNAKLEIKRDSTAQIEVSYAATPNDEHQDRPFTFTFGCSCKSTAKVSENPVQANLDFHPAATLAILYGDGVLPKLEGDKLIIKSASHRAEIDAETGRLVFLDFEAESEGGKITIHTAPGALALEQQRIDANLAQATSSYDAATPWCSAFEFMLDEWIFVLEQVGESYGEAEQIQKQAAGWRAVRQLVKSWQPPLPMQLVKSWQPPMPQWLQPGQADQKDAQLALTLPPQMTDCDYESLLTDRSSQKQLSGALMAVYRRIAPDKGWLWPVGRDALLDFAGEDDLTRNGRNALARSADLGPIGKLALAWLNTDDAALYGLASMSGESFRRDYEQIMDGESYLSKWVLSLAEAARSLSEQELRDLTALIGDHGSREMAAAALARLKANRDEAAAQALSAALDEAWRTGLREQIRTALIACLPAPNDSPQERTASRPGGPDDVQSTLTDALNRLQSLDEELRKGFSAPSSDK